MTTRKCRPIGTRRNDGVQKIDVMKKGDRSYTPLKH
jgi:hypothetical protein